MLTLRVSKKRWEAGEKGYRSGKEDVGKLIPQKIVAKLRISYPRAYLYEHAEEDSNLVHVQGYGDDVLVQRRRQEEHDQGCRRLAVARLDHRHEDVSEGGVEEWKSGKF